MHRRKHRPIESASAASSSASGGTASRGANRRGAGVVGGGPGSSSWFGAKMIAFVASLFFACSSLFFLAYLEETTTTRTTTRPESSPAKPPPSSSVRGGGGRVDGGEGDAAAAAEPVEEDEGEDGAMEYQTVFSTSCSPFQNWQSYMVFHSAWKMGQPGHVTRIVSGCTEDEADELREFHRKSVSTMSSKFHLHVSPEFRELMAKAKAAAAGGASDGKEGEGGGGGGGGGEGEGDKMSDSFQVTKYFNKPFGLRHWMEETLGLDDSNVLETKRGDAIVILIDPDMLLLRPITNDFRDRGGDGSMVWTKRLHDVDVVTHGKPMASTYGYGDQPFRILNLTTIVPDDSPALKVSSADAGSYYPAGPPYVATARDTYNIAKTWTELSPKVHVQYPKLLAEMFSYSVAAAHLNLPHQLSRSFMVSDPGAGKSEGWHMIDDVPPDRICDWDRNRPLPLVLHYCQRSLLGTWVVTKYRLRKDFLSCGSPLLKEPPSDIASTIDYAIEPPKKKGRPPGERKKYSPTQAKRHAFMLCRIIPAFNEAAVHYKENNCRGGEANYDKTLVLFDDPW